MVKTLNVHFDDDDFEALTERKKELGLEWRDFIMTLIPKKEVKQ